MVHERVRRVIATVFDRDEAELPGRLDPQTVDGWSSLRHLRILIALQEEFGIEIDPDAAPMLVSDQAMTEFLTAALGAGAAASGEWAARPDELAGFDELAGQAAP
jgi:acyl carrier protein